MYTHKVAAYDIDNLTDARYFAARMVDWMFLKVPEDSLAAKAFIKDVVEWVEGPYLGIDNTLSTATYSEYKNSLKGNLSALGGSVGLGYNMIWIHSSKDLMQVDDQLLNINALVVSEPDNRPEELKIIARFAYQKSLPLWIHIPSDLSVIEQLQSDILFEGWFFKGSPEEAIGYKSYDHLDEAFELISD